MRFFTHEIDCGAGIRSLRTYLPDVSERGFYGNKRPAVVIFPGGGYHHTSTNEAETVALTFVAAGICAFVLDYTVSGIAETVYPYAQYEAFAAISYVRENAASFCIDERNISALGFSAGGHLCACTGTLWNKPIMAAYLGGDVHKYRPDKLILGYPVIRAFVPCHEQSFINLLGSKNLTQEMLEQFSLERQVDNDTPPTFIWLTAEDRSVPIQGALEFAHALADNDTYVELHLYPHGGHGLSLANHLSRQVPFNEPANCAEWVDKAIRFMFDNTIIQKNR